METQKTGKWTACPAGKTFAGVALAILAGLDSGHAQEKAELPSLEQDLGRFGGSGEIARVPVTKLFPGDVAAGPDNVSPVENDPAAVERGMLYFNQFNCVGCHAANGAGGMGPSLSNASFTYGDKPEQIFLTILQGRPNGMPTFGGMLPDEVIWDLVAYIGQISKEPSGEWGKTTSVDGFKIEQVPAEYLSTSDPWEYKTPFSYGQKPYEKTKGAPSLESPAAGAPPK
ncbi:c-type cytochrome [Aurantimonas marina]|uniref:c-type cytochrome n=1 Tax=Aurantimonas marina TaxID=2780508 RepID=UPI0019D16692|nr:c-type cytochrome [Aurantimonas marina]